jgi:hypothetical protein
VVPAPGHEVAGAGVCASHAWSVEIDQDWIPSANAVKRDEIPLPVPTRTFVLVCRGVPVPDRSLWVDDSLILVAQLLGRFRACAEMPTDSCSVRYGTIEETEEEGHRKEV